MISLKKNKVFRSFIITLLSTSVIALAASPSVFVDFDMSGRSIDQVNESGWNSWDVTETSSTSKTFNGVTFTFSKNSSIGTAIKTDWYKSGIVDLTQRLTQDGLIVVDGNSGGSIKLVISGLSTGTHSLKSYHNSTNGYDWAPIDISVNGVKKISKLQPTNREGDPVKATTSYITFNATAGQSVNIIFSPDMSSSSAYKNVVINGFALNVPDAKNQAQNPIPAHNDLHIDADNGSYDLKWTKASSAVKSHLFLGIDSATVFNASGNDAINVSTGSTYTASNLSTRNLYYWRVDQEDANGLITKGDIWRFAPRRLAFIGAEGYGRYARGGRGGRVVHVTNLNDVGAGSLREAVENDIGPRTIVFDVSGIIFLKSRLTLSSDNVTVAGQTAPGKGIVIRGAPFGFSGVRDGIMRFIRIRLGAGQTFDGTGLQGSDHCIFDHNTINWTIDESFSSRSGRNITLQKTMIAEALNAANHQNYPVGTKHGYAATISGDVGSFHHNLLAHNEGRNWSLGGGLDGNGYFSGRLDIFNNVVYNWGGRTTDGGAHEVNFVNNYYKTGAATKIFTALNIQFDNFPGTQKYFCSGNIVTGHYDNPNATRNACATDGVNPDPWVSSPFFPSYATTHTAKHAYKVVLSDVGANMPILDAHDLRILNETLNGTTSTVGSYTGIKGLIDHENDANADGYANYPTQYSPAGWDSDGDGMPAWFENYIGTNPNGSGFDEANADRDGDEYTNLEEYLHFMATYYKIVAANSSVQINLNSLFAGFTNKPTYTVSSNSCLNPSISNATLIVSPTSKCGLHFLTLSVKDADNNTFERQVAFFIEGSTGLPTEPINYAPVFTTGDSLSHFENSPAIATIKATDAEGDAITWSIGTGSDSDFFTIDPNTGLLSFKNAPDFENPLDGGNNNIYWVYIRASDNINFTEQKTAIHIQNVDDDITPNSIPGLHFSNQRQLTHILYDLRGKELLRLNTTEAFAKEMIQSMSSAIPQGIIILRSFDSSGILTHRQLLKLNH